MLAVITCFFNPTGCPMRLANYNRFREHIGRTGAALYTVELVFGDKPFQLAEDDASWVKQVRGNDLMFQKERMLNIALQHLPPKYDEVVWMDCDLFFFFEDDWTERVSAGLREYKVIQPYSYMVALPNCEFSRYGAYQTNFFNCWGSGRIKRSYAYYQSKRQTFANFHHGHVGYVWAARRDFLERHKFYDPIVSGAGDLFMLMAFTGHFGWLDYPDELKRYNMDAAIHFFDWGFPVFRDTGGKIGYTSDVVFHMWHGDVDHRNYLSASRHLQACHFNPKTDLAVDPNGCWVWASNKPKLHQAMKNIFKSQQTG